MPKLDLIFCNRLSLVPLKVFLKCYYFVVSFSSTLLIYCSARIFFPLLFFTFFRVNTPCKCSVDRMSSNCQVGRRALTVSFLLIKCFLTSKKSSLCVIFSYLFILALKVCVHVFA